MPGTFASAAQGLPPPLSALLRPDAYPHPVAAVQLVETHISWVLLTGPFAYKIKKPVCYPFVDQRSLQQRTFLCAQELLLNRRFAPELYVDVCAITLEPAGVRMAGSGEVIEHAVRMRQFHAEDELAALLGCEALAPSELLRFGRELACRHEQLPAASPEHDWGRPSRVRALLLQNFAECLQAAAKLEAQRAVQDLEKPFVQRLDAAGSWLARRRQAGKVRECHGDLHVGNIVRYGDHLLAFDCLEFEPAFRWIDVAEEVACLFMDLGARNFATHAHAFLAGYLRQSGDYQLCRLLQLYGVHRALVRAKIAALRAEQVDECARAKLLAEYSQYLTCASALLTVRRPLLVITCGVSGSGKSWLAERLAPQLQAVHLRSDVERRRIGGLADGRPSGAALEQGLYSPAMTERVYGRLEECAADVLAGGLSVIVDATFQHREQRARLRALALASGAIFFLVFCHAPNEVLEMRLAARKESGSDPSEADQRVLALQCRRFQPPVAAEDLQVIDADTSLPGIVAQILQLLRRSQVG